MMRLRSRVLALVAAWAASLAMLAGSSAYAQESVQFEGNVFTKGADGKEVPVDGATIDIYRTDIKSGKWEIKTNKAGRYIMLGLPVRAVVTVVVSGPGLNPTFQTGIRAAAGEPIKFVLQPGNGARPSMEDVMKAGGAAPPPTAAVPEADRKKAEEERLKMEAERAKLEEVRGTFDAKKNLFDAGIKATQAKDYQTAVTSFDQALEGLEGADPKYFGELVEKTSSNLAEAHYQLAVELFNKRDKEGAKKHLEQAAASIDRSLKLAPEDPVYNAIQGKTLFLLVDKYSDTDKAEIGAKAYAKAAEKELDPKRKLQYQTQVGDVYRAGFMTDQAVAAYKQVLVSDPDNLSAMYGIGLTGMRSADSKDYQMAADYLKAFADKAPSDPRTDEVKQLLATLEKEFKIKPKPIR
jgi:tetratricopeptide (TPR) repeat protein